MTIEPQQEEHAKSGRTTAHLACFTAFHLLAARCADSIFCLNAKSSYHCPMDEKRLAAWRREFERLGIDAVRRDLADGGHRLIGGTPEKRGRFREWLVEIDAKDAMVREADRRSQRFWRVIAGIADALSITMSLATLIAGAIGGAMILGALLWLLSWVR